MADPVPGGSATVHEEPRYQPAELAQIAGVLLTLWIAISVAVVVLIKVDKTELTRTGTDGKSTTVTSDELLLAGGTIKVLLILGAFLVCAGILVGFAEMTKMVATVPLPDGETRELDGTGSGVLGWFLGAAQLLKSAAEALKSTKASIALLVVGVLVMVAAAAIAWQTIPGTDRTTSITIGDAETSGSGVADTSHADTDTPTEPGLTVSASPTAISTSTG